VHEDVSPQRARGAQRLTAVSTSIIGFVIFPFVLFVLFVAGNFVLSTSVTVVLSTSVTALA